MLLVTKNDKPLAAAARARARAVVCAGELPEEIPDAIDEAGLRRRLFLGRRRYSWRRGRKRRGRLRRSRIHVAAIFERRAQSHLAHEDNRFGRWVGRRFG